VRIVHDVPGDRLTLEGKDQPVVPKAALGCLALFLLPFVFGPMGAIFGSFSGDGGTAETVIALVFSAVWYGVLAFGLTAVVRRARAPFRLDVDRSAGELRLVDRNVFGGSKRERVLPLARLRSIGVQRSLVTARAPSPVATLGDDGMPVALTLVLAREGQPDQTDTERLTIGVADLDQPAEVADFAFRLGAAAGLPFSKVVRNDPRAVEIELSGSRGPGFSASPRDLARADYARDAVAPSAQAALAHEKVAPFDAASFPCAYRVVEWTPGARVVLRKPLTFGAFGCLPFTLLLLTGPVVYLLLLQQPQVELTPRLVAAGLSGLVGLILGTIAVSIVVSALPRSIEIDWPSRTLTVLRTLRRSRVIGIDQLAALELRNIHRIHRSKNSTSHYYHCEIVAHRREGVPEERGPEPLLETTHFRDDPDRPYQATLPMVTELARALNVERRITDG
jgi:hypothetical protein